MNITTLTYDNTCIYYAQCKLFYQEKGLSRPLAKWDHCYNQNNRVHPDYNQPVLSLVTTYIECIVRVFSKGFVHWGI